MKADLMDITEVYSFISRYGEHIETIQEELIKIECWKYTDEFYFYFSDNGSGESYISKAIIEKV